MSADTGATSGQLELLEKDREHLMYLLKGGGRNARGLGCFALLWNAIVGGIAFMMVTAFLNGAGPQGQKAPPLPALAFIGVFLLIGIAFAYTWAYMKFGRTLVMVKRDTIGVQNDLFGWKRMKILNLNPGDRGKLTESYSENKVPVYQVEFSNSEGKLTFGVGLSPGEKDQLLNEIHKFLGLETGEIERETKTKVPQFTGSMEEARTALEQHKVEVMEDVRGEWLVRIVPRRTNKDAGVGLVVFLLFIAVWIGFVSFWTYMALQGSWLFALFSVPFHGAGLLMLGLWLYLAFGETELRLSRGEFVMRWSCLGAGGTTRTAVEEIREFLLTRRQDGNGYKGRGPRNAESTSYVLVAQKEGGDVIKVQFGNEEWLAALATYLNGLLHDLRGRH